MREVGPLPEICSPDPKLEGLPRCARLSYTRCTNAMSLMVSRTLCLLFLSSCCPRQDRDCYLAAGTTHIQQGRVAVDGTCMDIVGEANAM